MNNKNNRRDFLKASGTLGLGIAALPLMGSGILKPNLQDEESLYIIGPRKGYSPYVGTLLSTMTMMRTWMLGTAEGMSIRELDYQIDDQSNSVGAMLLHLAATERYYQLNTFDGMEWGSWSDEIKKEWDLAMGLGEEGRKELVGKPFSYYKKKLDEVREITKKGFAERDDEWLMTVDEDWAWGPTNNYCKWFHVCEHESNHNGQMKFIAKRVPA